MSRKKEEENSKKLLGGNQTLQPGDQVLTGAGWFKAEELGAVGDKVWRYDFALRPPENEGS